MNVGEATRQYQAALEAERRTRHEFDGVISAVDEVNDAQAATAAAQRNLDRVWLHAGGCS